MATTFIWASRARRVCTCNLSPTRCRVCRAPIIFTQGSFEDCLETFKEEIDPSPTASVVVAGPPPARNEFAKSLPSLRRNYAQANLRERMFPIKSQ